MPDGGITAYLATAWGVSASTAGYIIAAIEVAAIVATTAYTQDQQRKAANQAKDAYNASLRDRYVMIRGATEPRQIVLGRCRVSGPMFFVQSYGVNREHLVIAIALAAHEIDAIEQIYFDDLPCIVDDAGNIFGTTFKDTFSTVAATANVTISAAPVVSSVVAKAYYGTTVVPLTVDSVNGVFVAVSGARAGVVGTIEITYTPYSSPFLNNEAQSKTESFNNPGTSVTLEAVPAAGSVRAVYQVQGDVSAGHGQDAQDADPGAVQTDTSVAVTVVGNVVSNIPPPPAGATGGLYINYQVAQGASKARVRKYLGAPGQAADAGMIAAFPGLWTAAHTCSGIAYLVVELDYDPNAFPGGIPNISAQVRGAKVFDPRFNTTAWSDNLALLTRHYVTSPIGGRLDPSLVDDTSVIVAANVCDTTAHYVVNGQTYDRNLYRGGLSAKADARPQDVLNDLVQQGMAGKWVFVDGKLKIKAGCYSMPVLTLDETWLHDAQQVQVQPRRARGDIVNSITATFADEEENYQVVQMPKVAPPIYITEDGAELPLTLTLQAVQFNGQAQHIAGCQLRDSRASLVLSLAANMRAWPIEVFDTIYVNLDRFGWLQKTFEVQDASWSLNGGIALTLKETDATITQLDAAFLAYNPAQMTRLPSPWIVGTVNNLFAQSGTAQLLRQFDGTILSRILVTWSPVADAAVTNEGSIEIRYGRISTDPSTWRSIEVPGSDTQLYLTSVQDGAAYVITARPKNSLVSGAWTLPIVNVVIGKTAPPGNVTDLASVSIPSGALLTWDRNLEADYSMTELRQGGTNWDSATLLFKGTANTYTWISLLVGTHKVWAKHFDTSGNASIVATEYDAVIGAEDSGQASAAAAAAQASADAALQALAVIADNNVLDRGEKPDVRLDWEALSNQQAGIDAQAAAYGITTERAAYDEALAALAAYLNSIGPGPGGWADTAVDSPIDRAVFRAQWSAAYTARQALFNKIAAVAGTVARWDGISGIPYSSVYNNDDSVALGFSMEDWPDGQAYPTGWSNWAGGPSPVRETNLVRVGQSAVRYPGLAAGNVGIYRNADFRNTPLPAGTFLAGSVDIYLASKASGLPLVLVRLYTNADATAYRDTQVLPTNNTTGAWQRVPWSARTATGDRIYAVEVYVMGTWEGGSAGQFTGDVVFDNFLFAFYDASTDNTALSLTDAGHLSSGGVPLGSVSITGLGYSGDLNATYGADWATNVSGSAGVNAAITAAQNAANNAGNAAANAAAAASVANQALAQIASDSVLSPGEKPAVILDWQTIISEQASIDGNAANYAVSSAAYDASITALANYLGGLGPYAWYDLSGGSIIVGNDFRVAFANVYTARQTLLDAISAAAKARLGALATLNAVNTGEIVDNAVSYTATFFDAEGVMFSPAV